jgi:hypothetical protein
MASAIRASIAELPFPENPAIPHIAISIAVDRKRTPRARETRIRQPSRGGRIVSSAQMALAQVDPAVERQPLPDITQSGHVQGVADHNGLRAGVGGQHVCHGLDLFEAIHGGRPLLQQLTRNPTATRHRSPIQDQAPRIATSQYHALTTVTLGEQLACKIKPLVGHASTEDDQPRDDGPQLVLASHEETGERPRSQQKQGNPCRPAP